MTEMQDFVLWFLQELPAFFLAEPVCYFTGFAILFVVIRVVRDIIRI